MQEFGLASLGKKGLRMNRAWIVWGLLSFLDVQAAEYPYDIAVPKPVYGEKWVQISPDRQCLVDKAGNELTCIVAERDRTEPPPAATMSREEARMEMLKRLREEQKRLSDTQRPGPYQNPPALWPAPHGRFVL